MAEGGRHLRPGPEEQPARQPRRQASREPARDSREEPVSRRARPAEEPAPRRATRPAQEQAPRRARPAQEQPPRRARPAQEPVRDPWEEPAPRRPRRVEVEPPSYRRRRRRSRWLSKQNLPLILLVVVLVGGILFAGGKLAGIMLNYHRDRTAYNELADAAISSLAEPDVTTPPDVTPDPGQPETPVRSEVPIQVDWDLLREKNSDIVGWLYDAGNISYPVMQTSDNSYYLHRGWDKQPNTAGSLFADTNVSVGATYSNFLIYGHNMKDGSMFAPIMKYVDQSYYSDHPTMYYLTPWQNYRVELIAAHIVESTLNNFPTYFASDSEYQNYLDNITSHSFFRTNARVTTEYQLITLSTCDYSSGYSDPRFLLHGMLVPIQ